MDSELLLLLMLREMRQLGNEVLGIERELVGKLGCQSLKVFQLGVEKRGLLGQVL